MPPDDDDTEGSGSTGHRAYRSRRRRPCDRCRKGKQLCLITVEGEPCGGCSARRQSCTFNLPPLQRHRRQSARRSESPEAVFNKGPDIDIDTGNVAERGPVMNGGQLVMATGTGTTTSIPIPYPQPEPLPSFNSRPSLAAGTDGTNRPAPLTGIRISDVQPSLDPSWGSPELDMTGMTERLASSNTGGKMLPSPSPNRACQQPPDTSSHAGLINSSPVNLFGTSDVPLFDPDLWSALFQPNTTELQTGPDPVSLDLESVEGVESHFLGTGTFRGLTLREINTATQSIPGRPGMVEFRQVSADERYPVYFVRHPSLQYGQAPENGKMAWDKVMRLCAHLGRETLTQSLIILKDRVLPTLPIINYPQFEQACHAAEGSAPVPHSLLAAAVAHSASYIPSLRQLHQQLWAAVINAIDAEFRQPRLQVLQLVVLLLSSRPGVNFAQSDITLSRAIGAVHVLGLHIDPSQWSLPRWERSLRIRLFWAVLFHDKMRALLLGRPSHLTEDNYTTPIPTVEDASWDNDDAPTVVTPQHRASIEAFITSCRLVPIIQRILDGFMTLRAAAAPKSYLCRIGLLHEIRRELDMLEMNLPVGLQLAARNDAGTGLRSATGVCSVQVSILGLKILVHRMELDIVDREHPPHVLATVYTSALTTSTALVTLVSNLTHADRLMFWMPYTFHHTSNAGSLLLRIAAEYRLSDPSIASRAVAQASELCRTLARFWRSEQWDIADETLKRLAEPAFTVGKDCHEAREVYRIISEALGYHVADTAWDDISSINHMGFINDGFDPSIWMVDGLSWLNP